MLGNVGEEETTVENRFTKQTLNVPLMVCERGLRRFSRTETIDVSNILDLIIVKDFDGIEQVMENTSNLKKWRKYVDLRLSHLLVSRRFDISARGTCFLALYSEKPIVV